MTQLKMDQSCNTARQALVIGGGPAGLMAAQVLAEAGLQVTIAEAKPSLGRKFLMAGKSGLNLTKDLPFTELLAGYGTDADWLKPMIRECDASWVQGWAEGLGQTLFTGSTGRVFPVAMKASPLLRAWLSHLGDLGVQTKTRWRWTGWTGPDAVFDTPQGQARFASDVTVLALGGASWARLGANGAWAPVLQAAGAELTPFAPSNFGLRVDWSSHMAPLIGQAIKGVAFQAGGPVSRGEAVVSSQGLEGGGIYALSRPLRAGAPLTVDLLPDLAQSEVQRRLAVARGKQSMANHLRRKLKLGPVRHALLNEFARPLPSDPAALAAVVKALPVPHGGPRPLDQAISTAGGLPRRALTDALMLKARPGTFCAGEMLDWDAPTGGYLITACLATARQAAAGALTYCDELT